MKGHAITYSAAEMAWLEAHRLLPIAEYHAAFLAAFTRSDVSAANLHGLRKRKGWRTGRTGCFVKGPAAPNKGRPCAPGTGGNNPNAQRTQFAKGERRGVAVKLYKPIGTERTSREGYLERKTHDGMPLQSRWRAVHLIEWEAANGPVPEGHCLKCIGNKADTSPANWVCIPRSMLPRLNGGPRKRTVPYDGAAAEIKPLILAVAKLDQAAREKRS